MEHNPGDGGTRWCSSCRTVLVTSRSKPRRSRRPLLGVNSSTFSSELLGRNAAPTLFISNSQANPGSASSEPVAHPPVVPGRFWGPSLGQAPIPTHRCAGTCSSIPPPLSHCYSYFSKKCLRRDSPRLPTVGTQLLWHITKQKILHWWLQPHKLPGQNPSQEPKVWITSTGFLTAQRRHRSGWTLHLGFRARTLHQEQLNTYNKMHFCKPDKAFTERQEISRKQFRKAPKLLQAVLPRTPWGHGAGEGRCHQRGDATGHRRLRHHRASAVAHPALGLSVTYLLHINQKFTNLGASTIIFTFFTFFHIFTPAWRAKQQPKPRKTCRPLKLRRAVPCQRPGLAPRPGRHRSDLRPKPAPAAPLSCRKPHPGREEIRPQWVMRNSNWTRDPLLPQERPGGSQHRGLCQLAWGNRGREAEAMARAAC